jgi:hypothetical protein
MCDIKILFVTMLMEEHAKGERSKREENSKEWREGRDP